MDLTVIDGSVYVTWSLDNQNSSLMIPWNLEAHRRLTELPERVVFCLLEGDGDGLAAIPDKCSTMEEIMPEHKGGLEKKQGVSVKVTDFETGRELFSQELAPEFALCCCCTCCWHPKAAQK